jgi:SAM-dependent methyltransferase
VTAIDPASTVSTVRRVALHELREPPASFDAAVAVVSMHHVEPLAESCRRLAELVRPGGTLVLDEIDVDRFDEDSARWWLAHRGPSEDEHLHDAGEVVGHLRHHCHRLSEVRAVLAEWFALGEPSRGSYFYRWDMPPGLRDVEEQLIVAGRLPAVGARLVGVRRPGPA